MSSIEIFYQQALIADAAYLDFDDLKVDGIYNNELIKQALTTGLKSDPDDEGRGFTEEQAIEFLRTYEIVDYFDDDDLDDPTGASATLFQHKDGQYLLSIRGTEPSLLHPQDLIADAVLAFGNGRADDQHDAIKNFVQSQDMLEGKSFTVAGHSLGGHLTTIFTTDPDFTNQVSHAYTFNGAGIGGGPAGTGGVMDRGAAYWEAVDKFDDSIRTSVI